MVKCIDLQEEVEMSVKRKEIFKNTYLKSLGLSDEVDLHNLWIEALRDISETYGFSGKEDCSFLATKTGFTFEFFMMEVKEVKVLSGVCANLVR